MKKAVYPGTFDPVTYGHIDVIKRSSKMFDELVVGILLNAEKKPLFSETERLEMMKEVTKDIPNVTIEVFEGLTIDFARKCEAGFIVRGLRAVTDFEYELQMSHTNRSMAPEIDTIFLTTSLRYSYVSSSTTKDIARYGGDVSKLVPPEIENKLKNKLNANY